MHICASQFSKFSGGACPRTPLEGARASPRRDRYAITIFGALRVPRPPVAQILDPPLCEDVCIGVYCYIYVEEISIWCVLKERGAAQLDFDLLTMHLARTEVPVGSRDLSQIRRHKMMPSCAIYDEFCQAQWRERTDGNSD